MSHLVYLISLLLGIGGLLVIDRRLKLAFFYNSGRTVKTLAPAILLFILWDVAGIIKGIFGHGNGQFNLPFVIAPEFPVEEIFFLFLLCYVTLILYRLTERKKS